jgi:hypothetical protein
MAQYPFWKDREIAENNSEILRLERENFELKKKLSNVTCPKCGHKFNAKD